MRKSRVTVDIVTDNVREFEGVNFEKELHRAIGTAISGFIEDNDVFEENVLEDLMNDFEVDDFETLGELGNIDMRVRIYKVPEAVVTMEDAIELIEKQIEHEEELAEFKSEEPKATDYAIRNKWIAVKRLLEGQKRL